jgi:alginate O-acetyltransferase complex protein AlgI
MNSFLDQISDFLFSWHAWPVYLLALLALVWFTVKEPAERFRILAMCGLVVFLTGGIGYVLTRYFGVDSDKLIQQLRYDEDNLLLFNSAFFLCFFTIFLLFFLIVYKQKLTRVILFSVFSLYFFYKACGWYVIFILIAAVVDFILSNAIWKTTDGGKKKALLILSLVLNLGLLAVFKYTKLFILIVNDFTTGHIDPIELLLPVGISFYTFENLSYTLDVYRGHFKPVTNFFDYLFFLSFFPKLMMGPIVRAADFIPQIRQDINVRSGDVGVGLYLILSGLFRKVVISDYIWFNFGQYVFDDPSRHTGAECLFAVYCYALVIYCDFSGYSDMAIGMARWMGFKVPANFDSPYQSSNVTEFWRRWHISLSAWLKDYLYISLGGNRGASKGTWIVFGVFLGGSAIASIMAAVNHLNFWPLIALSAVLVFLFLPKLLFKNDKNAVNTSVNQLNTMLLGGLWHGASWNFLFWGFLHGIALAFDKIRMRFIPNSKLIPVKIIGALLTFHFVCLAWIFFKCESFDQATIFLNRIWNNFAPETMGKMFVGYSTVFWLMGLAFMLHMVPGKVETSTQKILGSMPVFVKMVLVIGFVWILIQVKQAEQMMPIYLQF